MSGNRVDAHDDTLSIGRDQDTTPRQLDTEIAGATITVGAEATNVVNVAVQLTDANGDNIAYAATFLAYLSDASTGLDVSAAGPDGGVAVGTDGDIVVALTASIALLLQTEADGNVDLDWTDAGAMTKYLVVVLPNGKHVVSGALTWAA